MTATRQIAYFVTTLTGRLSTYRDNICNDTNYAVTRMFS